MLRLPAREQALPVAAKTTAAFEAQTLSAMRRVEPSRPRATWLSLNRSRASPQPALLQCPGWKLGLMPSPWQDRAPVRGVWEATQGARRARQKRPEVPRAVRLERFRFEWCRMVRRFGAAGSDNRTRRPRRCR
jgi:hypothetical protein